MTAQTGRESNVAYVYGEKGYLGQVLLSPEEFERLFGEDKE